MPSPKGKRIYKKKPKKKTEVIGNLRDCPGSAVPCQSTGCPIDPTPSKEGGLMLGNSAQWTNKKSAYTGPVFCVSFMM